MCQPAPVCLQFIADVEARFDIPATYNKPGPGGVYLGSVGDQAHATRKSSHNCAPMQESPVNGVAYAPGYAHAVDYRPATKKLGEEMAALTLADPRCRYVIYDNVGRYPDGDTWTTSHPTWHVSFLPGTHNDVRPFFATTDQGDLTMADIDKLIEVTRNQGKQTRNTIKNQGVLTRHAIAKWGGATQDELQKILAELVDEDA